MRETSDNQVALLDHQMHIGLASPVVPVGATGGSMEFAERPVNGTAVTVTVADHLEQN